MPGQADETMNISHWMQKSTVFYETDDFCVDLGAIAKGYIADELKRLLEEDYHIQSAILNLGGNIITIGSKPDGSDWNIGIVNPKSPDDMEHPAFYIRATGKTFVTSGNYQRYFEDETGKRYHHILTVIPVIHQRQAWTVSQSSPMFP